MKKIPIAEQNKETKGSAAAMQITPSPPMASGS